MHEVLAWLILLALPITLLASAMVGSKSSNSGKSSKDSQEQSSSTSDKDMTAP